VVTRFLHVGDVHLQHGHPRNPDRLASLDQILAHGLAFEGLGAWLIPGDLFHSRSSVTDRNDLAERLVRMADRAPVVLVRGNHDQPGDLDIFAKLKARWPVSVVTRPDVLRVPLPTGETAAIACLPYPDKFGLVAAGVAPGDVVRTAGELLDTIVMTLAHGLETEIAAGCIPLFIGHANIRGAIASTGQPQIGQEIELETAMLARLRAVYCGLNHIHKPQQVGDGVFAGSIAAMDYGEAEAKSVVLIEAARDPSGTWRAQWTRRPLETPPMHHVEGRLTRDGFVTGGGELHHAHIIDWTGCDVRVRYSFKASEKDALDHDSVRRLFAAALRLKIEPIAEPDRALRSQAVADATTLADKLVAYAETLGTVTSDDVLAKLAALEHTDSLQLIANVEHALAVVTDLSPADTQTEVAPDETFEDPADLVPAVLRSGR